MQESIQNLKKDIETATLQKHSIEAELDTTKKQLKDTESEIKVLVIEMEKRKKAAQEKLLQMTQLFKD